MELDKYRITFTFMLIQTTSALSFQHDFHLHIASYNAIRSLCYDKFIPFLVQLSWSLDGAVGLTRICVTNLNIYEQEHKAASDERLLVQWRTMEVEGDNSVELVYICGKAWKFTVELLNYRYHMVSISYEMFVISMRLYASLEAQFMGFQVSAVGNWTLLLKIILSKSMIKGINCTKSYNTISTPLKEWIENEWKIRSGNSVSRNSHRRWWHCVRNVLILFGRLTVDCEIKGVKTLKAKKAKLEHRAANEIHRINKYNCFLSDGTHLNLCNELTSWMVSKSRFLPIQWNFFSKSLRLLRN